MAQALLGRGWSGASWGLVIGLLYTVAGTWMIVSPVAAAISLSVLIAVLFIAEGVMEVAMALRLRPDLGWGRLLLSGLVALVAGGLIAMELPTAAGWAVGLIVGVNLISTGVGFASLALAAKRENRLV